MAVYRRNWNGLTQLNPDPVFIPECMQLQVFDVRKPAAAVKHELPAAVRTKHHRKRRAIHKAVVTVITSAAAMTVVLAFCLMDVSAVPAWLSGVILGSLSWLGIFAWANAGGTRK